MNQQLEAINSLTVRERDAVIRYYYEGQSHEIIAGAYNVTANAIQKRINRGIVKLGMRPEKPGSGRKRTMLLGEKNRKVQEL